MNKTKETILKELNDCWMHSSWSMSVPDILSDALDRMAASVREDCRRNIGFLRQWLNEDRITDPKKMVTNLDIEVWLSLTSTSSGQNKEFDMNKCECANQYIECANCANDDHDEHCQKEETK